jgi:hypothetical protein
MQKAKLKIQEAGRAFTAAGFAAAHF